MRSTCLSSFVTYGVAAASRLQFENFLRSRGCCNPKNPNSSELTGWVFLSITVSGYHINTISMSFGRSKTPISGFRHSGYPEAQTKLKTESTYRKPLRSYSYPPKIIRLLPKLLEQLKFFFPQHGLELVPCRLI